MSSLLRSAASHRLTRIVRAVVPLLLLAALIQHVGAEPFERSLQVLTAGPIIAALLLGVITTTAQALRWRTVAGGYGAAAGLTRYRAVAECYRSALLNAVLPGGVLGDAVRAWRQRAPRERGLRSSAQAVIGERVAGTVLLMLAVALVTLPLKPVVSAMALAGAAGATVVAAPTLKRLQLREQLAVWGWSALALSSLVTKFAVAALALGTVTSVKDMVTLALIMLAGMSIPFGVGGFGPREAVAAIAFVAVGLTADSGVTTAAAYGVLAAVSALPGVLVMLLDLRRPSTERPAPALAVRPTVQAVRPVRPARAAAARVPALAPALSTALAPALSAAVVRTGRRVLNGNLVDLNRAGSATHTVGVTHAVGASHFESAVRPGRDRHDRLGGPRSGRGPGRVRIQLEVGPLAERNPAPQSV